MIAPHELKNKAFTKSVRGYNCSEVDEYVDFLIERYTEVYRQNAELDKELRATNAKYNELHSDEDAIRAVIVKAQKLSETMIKQAKAESDKIIAAAEAKCLEKVEEAKAKIEESREEVEKIKAASEAFRQHIYSQYANHLKQLQAMDLNFNTDDATKELVTETSEVIADSVDESKSNIDSIGNEE